MICKLFAEDTSCSLSLTLWKTVTGISDPIHKHIIDGGPSKEHFHKKVTVHSAMWFHCKKKNLFQLN
jgi:hypothetical protein